MRGAPLGRTLLVAFALGGALAVPAGPALGAAPVSCETSDPCLAVHLPDGEVDAVSSTTLQGWAAEAVAAHQPNAVADPQDYPQRTTTGIAVDPVTVHGGLSINALLTDVGVDPATVTFTDMPRADGSWSILPAAELSATPTVFQDPTLMPAYYAPVGQDQMLYARPLLNAADSNLADDEISGAPNGALELFVHDGPLLTVTAKATVGSSTVVTPQTTVKRGQPVSFMASATGDTVAPTFTWTLNNRTEVSKQQDLTYSFAAAGTYEMQVSAAGTDDSGGAAAPLYVQVGKARYTGPPSPGSGRSPTPRPTPSPATTPTPTTTPRPRQPGSGAPSSAPSAPSTKPAASAPAVPAGGSAPPKQPAQPGDAPIVSGRLIGSTVALLTPSRSLPDRDTIGVAPAARLSAGWRATALAGSIAAIMLLFAAGAAREMRGHRRRRSVVRPR